MRPGAPAPRRSPHPQRSWRAPGAASVAAVGAAVLVAGLLAGCSEPEVVTPTVSPVPEPTSPQPSPPETTPTDEIPEAPPPRPAAMDRDDAEGAIAAAKYFMELYPYVYATGDLTEWEAMSHPECRFCASVVDNVTDANSRGERVVGGKPRWLGAAEHWFHEDLDVHEVQVRAEQGSAERRSPTGEVLERHESNVFDLFFNLSNSNDSWVVVGVNLESDDA